MTDVECFPILLSQQSVGVHLYVPNILKKVKKKNLQLFIMWVSVSETWVLLLISCPKVFEGTRTGFDLDRRGTLGIVLTFFYWNYSFSGLKPVIHNLYIFLAHTCNMYTFKSLYIHVYKTIKNISYNKSDKPHCFQGLTKTGAYGQVPQAHQVKRAPSK